MADTFIPLSVPNLKGNELKYVTHAVETEWVSTAGPYVEDFEKHIADYVSMPGAVACQSGTAGLHIALLLCGVTREDMVLVPTLTFIAAVNPVKYIGAEPMFMDCDDSLCIDPDKLERFCREECRVDNGYLYHKATNRRIPAMVAVHVFGNMANMPGLVELCRKYGLVLIEDSTEALGTYYTEGPYRGKMAGTIGDIGVYSFNGNKIITTGAGGMVVSNHADWLERAKHLSTQAKADELQFVHDEVGYNYRLTNLQAALGLAQLEQLEGFIAHKNEMYDFYKERLDGKNGYRILPFRDGVRSNKWFYSLYLEDARHTRDGVIAALKAQNIQTRPVWALIHEQADYGRNETYGLAMAEDFRAKIVNLPCSTNLTREDAQRVVDALLAL